MVRFATTYTASERRHARSAINTIRSVVMERQYATRHLGEMLLTASHHASCPAGAGRRFRSSLRSQRPRSSRKRQGIPLAHCVRSGMVKPTGGNRGEMGGEGKGSGNGTPQPAAHLPFFSPLAAHHSAKRDSVERNLRARYDLQRAIIVNYQRQQTVFGLNPSHNICFIPSHRCKACIL